MSSKRLRSGWRVAVMLAALGGLGAWQAPAAFAVSSDLTVRIPGDGAGWTATPTTAMLPQSPLVPGGKATGTIELRNSGTSAASVDLAFTDISGPLAAELHYAAACAGAAGRSWSGTLGELQTGVVVDGALPAGAVVACSLTESMPANADNRWEGASASFDEVFSLVTRAAAPARVVVPGSNAAGGAGSGGLAAGTHRPAGLAFTGTDSYRMFEIAGAALLFGCLLVWVAWVAADHDTRRRSV